MKTVPSIWYKEYVNELARNAIHDGAKNGIDSEKYQTSKQKWLSFKSKYKPSKDVKQGDLVLAKKFIVSKKSKILAITSIHDKNDPYNLIGVASDKFFLSEKQTDRLMAYMSKMNLLY